MTIVMPTMTTDGFVSDINTMLIKVYDYFLTSNYSQTVLFYKNISSLKYILNRYKDDVDTLKGAIIESLQLMTNGMFEDIEITVAVNDTGGTMYISIEMSVTDNGEMYTLSKAVDVMPDGTISTEDKINYLLGE